jgi:hypothetical protein
MADSSEVSRAEVSSYLNGQSGSKCSKTVQAVASEYHISLIINVMSIAEWRHASRGKVVQRTSGREMMIAKTKGLLAATLVAAVTLPTVAPARVNDARLFEPRDPVIIAAPGFYNPNSPAATGAAASAITPG